MKRQYVFLEPSITDNNEPLIVGSGELDDVSEDELLSWREAKKLLRNWYLEKARSLRTVSEKDYFGNE